MLIDKFETYMINIAGLNSRSTRKRLIKICKQINFCETIQYSINRKKGIYYLELSLPKQELPYVISFLSFHQMLIYQILSPKHVDELLDSDHLYQASKRFELSIDGLQDPFIKDKIIDIMTMFSNHNELNYTLNHNCACVSCSPETFAKLLQIIATRNIDILSASYRSSANHKSRIS